MVASISHSTVSASTLPLSVRAESAASILSNSGASNQSSDPVLEAAEPVKIFRYNSFEFVYKQNFGKIVLLRQEPQTGNEIAQFPSEYYLQQYAATARAQRSAVLTAAEDNPVEPAGTDGLSAQSDTAVTTPAAATVAASPSPAPPPAARVDIKV